MKNRNWMKFCFDGLWLTLGCVIFAAGVACFYDPNSLAPGGVSGIAIIITKFLDVIPTGTLIALINIPIMIIGTIRFGFRFLGSTIYAVVVSSLAIDLLERYIGVLTTDPLLAAVGGAVLVGAGIGLVFRAGATTGGTDIIVKLFRLKFRHLKTGVVFAAVDGAVVLLSGIVFRNIEIMIYSSIALMLQSVIMNKVLYGGNGARLVYIISERYDEISRALLGDLDLGATFLQANGAYTGKETRVLMVAMRMRAFPQVRDVVKNIDPVAFMIVTNASSVFGEGFRPYDEEDV